MTDREFSFKEWQDFQDVLESNREVVWSDVPEGQELYLFENYPHVESFSRVENDVTLSSEVIYLLPPDNDGNLRYVSQLWTAEGGFDEPSIVWLPVDSPRAKDLFRVFVDEAAPREGDHRRFGFMAIYSGRLKHFVYSKRMFPPVS